MRTHWLLSTDQIGLRIVNYRVK
jgi:hypothetical protein